jgi:DNA invertase Pin-like site-specific DNA recombinase
MRQTIKGKQAMTDRSGDRKAIIYCRVSSATQENDGHGLESQETRCRQRAAALGLEVAAVFPDTFSGGGDYMQRPGMKALLAFLDAQPTERFVVIFDDLKRASRDTRAFLDLRDAFRSRDVMVECLNFKFDDTPEGEFIETIIAAQGALERKQNGRQVAQKMQARMENGYWVHNAPVGYRYEKQKGRGKVLVPNEPLASIVRDAFEGYASGRFQSQAEVKRFFEGFAAFPRNRKGVITQQRVTEILTQPLYTGHICSERYELNWLKGQHDGLISLETFDAVQERRQGVAKLPARKNIGDDFALRGFVLCGDCDKPLRSSWAKGNTKRYPYYLCQTKGCASYGKSIPRDKLEGDFETILKAIQPGERLVDMVTHMFRRAWTQRQALVDEMITSAKQRLNQTEKQIDALLDRVMEATSPSVIGAYEDKIARLERDKAKLAEKLVRHVPEQRTFDEMLELSCKFLASPWKLWETGNMTLRRTVLRLTFEDRLRYHRNKGARTPKTTLPFKALEAIGGQAMRDGAPCRTSI